MKQSQIALAKILTYSGTLPLLASVLLMHFPVPGINGNVIAYTYSAIIVSFLSGIHWAVYLFFPDKCPRNLLITSNAVALIAWGSLLLKHLPIVLLAQLLCFLYLLVLDLKLRDAAILPQWFYTLRRNATIIVVLCVLSMIIFS